MEKITKKLSTEEQLLQARQRGLQEASQIHSMQAHGKVFGLDTFSWIEPHPDMLSTMILSFPFAMNWIGTHDQIKTCIELYPEIVDHLESVTIFDQTELEIPAEFMEKIPVILSIEGVSEAATIVKSFTKKTGAILFTADGFKAPIWKREFEQFIDQHS